MALNKTTFGSALAAIAADPPESYPEAAERWANAVEAYASTVVPASVTVTAAAASLQAALASAFAAHETAVAALEAAFAALAVTVGGGMVGYVAVPPPGPIGFASLMTPPFPETHADGGATFADAIDAWMKTGTATPTSGPPPVFWS